MQNVYVYTAKQKWQKPVPVKTLFICCSDPMFVRFFEEFRNFLGIKDYGPITIPGGPHTLVAPPHLPEFTRVAKFSFRLLASRHAIKKIVGVAHNDCGWYKRVYDNSTEEGQISHLRQVHASIKAQFPEVQVDLYFARRNKKSVQFLRI